MIKRLTYFLAILGMITVAFVPARASAGWGWWGGPGISIYVGRIRLPAVSLLRIRLPAVSVLRLSLRVLRIRLPAVSLLRLTGAASAAMGTRRQSAALGSKRAARLLPLLF